MSPDMLDDSELLAAMQSSTDAGRSAFRELYDRHAPWLIVRLSRRCSDPLLVDEAVQDTFVAIWKRPHAYRGRGDVAAWIWGIAVRRLIDLLRHNRRDALLLDHHLGDRSLGIVESAEEAVLVGVEYGRLNCALQELSPELRAVVQATILDGLTTKEAAQLLGIPQGTVKTRMKRARETMREALA